MPTNVVLSLPDDTYDRAEQLAGLIGGNVSDVLSETLSLTLPPLNGFTSVDKPIARMSNTEVEALADSQMDEVPDRRFSHLLDKQQRGTLLDEERGELAALLHVYQAGLLRKAEALRVSVQRGLRESLKP